MRIEEKQFAKKLNSPLRPAHGIRIEEKTSSDFSDLLQHEQGPNWQAALDQLLLKLDELGRRMVKSFSFYDVKAYKDTLQVFLQETLGRSFNLKEERGWSRQGKPKLYQSIQLINTELEKLTRLTLDKEKDSLKVLAQLDKIRGLLVDLYS